MNEAGTYRNRIASARGETGMSQEEFAVACGIGKATLQNYERGVREPPASTLARISELTGHSMEWLVCVGSEERQEPPHELTPAELLMELRGVWGRLDKDGMVAVVQLARLLAR